MPVQQIPSNLIHGTDASALISRLMINLLGGNSAILGLKRSTAEKDKACYTLYASAYDLTGALVFCVMPSGKVITQKVIDHTLENLAQRMQVLGAALRLRTQCILFKDTLAYNGKVSLKL
jgi:hypothetical protein